MDERHKVFLEQEFKKYFGRDPGEPAKQEILDEGKVDCKHSRIFYINNAFDGQAWWCDDCSRHERIDYSPGFMIKFPTNALISTPNPNYGAEGFYALKTDGKGTMIKLEREKWISRKK